MRDGVDEQMLDLKRILAPVDLGPESRKVLHTAGEIASVFRSEVVAMHVVQPVPPDRKSVV